MAATTKIDCLKWAIQSLEALPVAVVCCGVGAAFTSLVGEDELAELVVDGDDCVGSNDTAVVSAAGVVSTCPEELLSSSLESLIESPLGTLLSLLTAQEDFNFGAFMRSSLPLSQKSLSECSAALSGLRGWRQLLKQQMPFGPSASWPDWLYWSQRYFVKLSEVGWATASRMVAANWQSPHCGEFCGLRTSVNTLIGGIFPWGPSRSGAPFWLAHWIRAEKEYCWTMQTE